MKTVDFSETIAASDLKGSRSRHLVRRYLSIEGQGHFLTLAQAEMGPITFESNHYHYHYIAISSLPLPLHTVWKCNHYHYHYFGNVIHITHYFWQLIPQVDSGLAATT